MTKKGQELWDSICRVPIVSLIPREEEICAFYAKTDDMEEMILFGDIIQEIGLAKAEVNAFRDYDPEDNSPSISWIDPDEELPF